ncbi:hypothetical protein EDD15DRAFT_2111260, partial [Pisolithus albus]
SYTQPVFAYQTPKCLLTVNGLQLEHLHMQANVEVEHRATVPDSTTLVQLVKVESKELTQAPTVLAAVLSEFGEQTTYVSIEFPVLFAIGDFQVIYYCKRKYRGPHHSRIQPYHLFMPQLLLQYPSGLRQF